MQYATWHFLGPKGGRMREISLGTSSLTRFYGDTEFQSSTNIVVFVFTDRCQAVINRFTYHSHICFYCSQWKKKSPSEKQTYCTIQRYLQHLCRDSERRGEMTFQFLDAEADGEGHGHHMTLLHQHHLHCDHTQRQSMAFTSLCSACHHFWLTQK